VRGVDNGTYQYSYDPMPLAKTAVLGMAGMDGGDGGWAVLMGDNALPASSGTINLAVDEDQLRDSERKHTTEQVAYFVIDPPLAEGAEDLPVVDPNAGVTPFNSSDVNGDGNVTPIDALLVINYLNRHAVEEGDMALDTNGDDSITPLDALLVINRLNRGGADSGQPEGEGSRLAAVDGYFSELQEDEELELLWM